MKYLFLNVIFIIDLNIYVTLIDITYLTFISNTFDFYLTVHTMPMFI